MCGLPLQDNRSLKEQNDELNGQIINLSIQGAKSLMSASFSDSLAAEINSVSRSEVIHLYFLYFFFFFKLLINLYLYRS